jgi:hypothetical protein
MEDELFKIKISKHIGFLSAQKTSKKDEEKVSNQFDIPSNTAFFVH